MPRLVLQFQDTVLKEAEVRERGVRIGRAPDNALVIDNPAVSHHHARAFIGPDGKLMLEDFGSLNGTFVNGQRIKTVCLNLSDTIAIGKHKIHIQDSWEPEGLMVWVGPKQAEAPKIQETAMLGTKERAEFLQQLAAQGESSQLSPERLKVPTLVVRKGKTDASEYSLTSNLTVIGKSEMATVKLRKWFAPAAAAQIIRRNKDSYYICAASRVPSVNGNPTTRPTKLIPGDIIDVAGIQLEFNCRA
ncbi:MAG TPA: FHA domain-containing protein [Bryobacteraceae bacterium]|nr:FHA domain-containing protein [Bryobacteraceae bacterium]